MRISRSAARKFVLSSRAHASEKSTSCAASGASYAFTSMEGKLRGGASPLQEPGFSLHGRLLEISNSLSEVELEQMKLLVKPKVDAFRLKRIKEGFKLFEELEARGELSMTYVKELLEGIKRFDLLQKLDVPLPNSAGTGRPSDQRILDKIHCKESPDEDSSALPALVDLFLQKTRNWMYFPEGMIMQLRNLQMECTCRVMTRTTWNSYSDAKERTRVPDSFNGGFPSNEYCSIAVSSSELSASSDMIAQSFSDDSMFSSCTSQDVCERSRRATPDLSSDVKNSETAGDSSFSPTSSKDEILESSLLPNDTDECESEGMATTEAGGAQGGGVYEISEASGGVCNGPMKPSHFEKRCAAGVGKDVVDGGPTRVGRRPTSGHVPGLMKDALPDGDISVEQNWSGARNGVGKDSTVDQSAADVSTQSNEWERLGARPRDRPPVKMAPLAPSLASWLT
ncbi:hypothetical protein ACROYT_G023458 [Oculina patagonica]